MPSLLDQLWPNVIQAESAGNPFAVSPAGAFGLAQLMPGTARDPGFGVQPFNPSIPGDNARMGKDYLRAMLDRYGQDPTKALAAYNWGPGNVDKWNGNTATLPQETRNYVNTVLGGNAPQQPQMIDNAQPPPAFNKGVPKTMPWYPQDESGLMDPQGLFGMSSFQPQQQSQGILPQMQPQPQQQATGGGRWGSGSSIWPMLMGLGAGIAGGNGWGEGLGKGFSQAAVLGQQARENDIREKLLKAQLGPDIKNVKVGGQEVSVRVYPDGRMRPVDTSALTGATAPLADFKDATSLRKEYTGSDQYKVWAQARPIYKTMEEASKRNSRASDVNMIYGLAKMFDPNSVVREGEMVIVKDTASLPEWLQGQINSLNGGASLGVKTREAVMTEARSRMRAYQDELKPVYDRTVDIAKRYGMPETDFGTKFEDLPEPAAAPTAPGAAPQAAPGMPTQNAGTVAPQSMAPRRYRFNPQTGQVELVQ